MRTKVGSSVKCRVCLSRRVYDDEYMQCDVESGTYNNKYMAI